MHIMSISLVLALICYFRCFLHGEHLKISAFPRVEVIFCILWDLHGSESWGFFNLTVSQLGFRQDSSEYKLYFMMYFCC